jgi:putative cell wall-binding protein
MKTDEKIKRLEDFHKAISENPNGIKSPDRKRLLTIQKQLTILKRRFEFEEKRKNIPVGKNPVELAREKQKNELRIEIQKEVTEKIDKMVRDRFKIKEDELKEKENQLKIKEDELAEREKKVKEKENGGK